MLHIYVCDDEPGILDCIAELIRRQIIIGQYDMKIEHCCTNPEALIAELNQNPFKRNLYFLDVELRHEKYNGFLLGKTIRRLDPNGTIIYITSFKDLAYKTFQYHIEAYDYIVKDTREKLGASIAGCLASIVDRLREETADPVEYYTLRAGERMLHVPVDEIYYFETSSRTHFILMHARHQRVEFLGNLSEIEKQLSDRFLKIHRSYLVALDKIDELDLKHLRLWVHGNECLISRRRKAALLERLGGHSG